MVQQQKTAFNIRVFNTFRNGNKTKKQNQQSGLEKIVRNLVAIPLLSRGGTIHHLPKKGR
ncbi:MAG: hypothetical protein ACI9N1_000548 [Flavobacteriales bacterium]|jgi:hypothetical protein